jgi:transglutaminase/protease-like cytokinesis protein 3
MAHNVKIKYYARENTKMKPHSFYGQSIPNGTYGFEQVCQQASKNTSIEAHTVRASVEEYMKVCMEKLLDGFRVEVGNQFLTLTPAITAKVKDEVDDQGNVKKAVTADDLTAIGARGRIGCVVNTEFTHEFNRSVKWQKTDKQGNPLEADEDDTTLDPEDEQNQGGGSSSSSSSSSGPSGGNSGGDNNGAGDME